MIEWAITRALDRLIATIISPMREIVFAKRKEKKTEGTNNIFTGLH